MSVTKFKALPCTISRGGFSDERVFTVKMGHGGDHQGVASRRHMWTDSGKPLGDGEPPLGEEITGYVAARVLKLLDQNATVSIPDGEVITVPVTALVDRPVEDHVPVGS